MHKFGWGAEKAQLYAVSNGARHVKPPVGHVAIGHPDYCLSENFQNC